MPTLRYYITGHGLGHASRSCQVLQQLHRQAPHLNLEVVTTAPDWFLKQNLPPQTALFSRQLDVGVCQDDSLQMNLGATLAAWQKLAAVYPERIEAESCCLQQHRVDLVVTDVAALPCTAAAHAGIPAVILSNFSWDWIYQGFLAEQPVFQTYIALQHQAYRQASLVLRLPFYGPMAFDCPIIDLPLVTRTARHSAAAVRRHLGLSPQTRLGLLSFGGFGLQETDLRKVSTLSDWVFLADPALVGQACNIRPLPGGYDYPDLVNAADAILTKPGYGIVAEAIAHDTPVLYTPRGNFREQPLLVDGLKRYTRALEIDNEPLRRGDWQNALQTLLELPPAAETIRSDGSSVAARHLLDLLSTQQ